MCVAAPRRYRDVPYPTRLVWKRKKPSHLPEKRFVWALYQMESWDQRSPTDLGIVPSGVPRQSRWACAAHSSCVAMAYWWQIKCAWVNRYRSTFYSSWKDSVCGSRQRQQQRLCSTVFCCFLNTGTAEEILASGNMKWRRPMSGFFFFLFCSYHLAGRKLHQYRSWTLLYLLIRRLFSTASESLPRESSFTPEFSAQKERNSAHPFLRVGKTSVVYIRSMKVLAIIHGTLPIIHQSACFHPPEGPLFSDSGSFIWSGAHLIFLGGHTVSKWLSWKAPRTRRLQAHFDRVDKKKKEDRGR